MRRPPPRSSLTDTRCPYTTLFRSPAQVGKAIKVPTPSRTLPADQVAEARGFADSYALRMKHHSEKLHAAARPAEPLAAAAFDAMERARIEALGARHMDGMRGNLAASLAMRVRSEDRKSTRLNSSH